MSLSGTAGTGKAEARVEDGEREELEAEVGEERADGVGERDEE